MDSAIIILLTQLLPVLSRPLVAPTHLLVTRVGPCYNRPRMPVTVSEMSLNREQYDASLSGQLNISQGVANGWSIKATMQKCHDIRNMDTCDFYKAFSVVKSGCADSPDEDLYTMFFHYLEPKLDCPLEAGSYTIKDFPFFTEDSDLTAAESKISTSVFGYTYRLEGYDEDEEKILCAEAYLQLLYVREPGWESRKAGEVPERPAPDTTSDEDATDPPYDEII